MTEEQEGKKEVTSSQPEPEQQHLTLTAIRRQRLKSQKEINRLKWRKEQELANAAALKANEHEQLQSMHETIEEERSAITKHVKSHQEFIAQPKPERPLRVEGDEKSARKHR